MPDSHQPFVIGQCDSRFLHSADNYRAEFEVCQSLACHDVLDPTFLDLLRKVYGKAEYRSDAVNGLGHRRTEHPPLASRALTMAMIRPPFMRWLETVTNRGPFAEFAGVVAESHATPDDHLGWHSDLNDPRRRLAITINLSETPFKGGLFEMRDRETGKILTRFQHRSIGSALIFSVAPRYEHRVLPVTSGGPRRMFAGWFLAGRK